jgi:hypothetical protein
VEVLRLREFRLLFIAQAVSGLGDRTVPIALAFAVLELGGSATAVGLVLTARMLPLTATLLVGGVVADRISRRTVMVAADTARFLTQGLLAVLLIAGVAELWTVALLVGLTGAAGGFSYPAATGLLPAVVPADQLQEANGLRATVLSAGEIAGPAVAGMLIAAVGPGWALAIDAVSFGISAALLALMRVPPAARAATSFLVDLREGWDVFRSLTWVWAFVVAVSLGNLLWSAWTVLGPVLAERELGGAAAWGLVLSALGAGTVAGGLIALRARPSRPLLLGGATFALFALPPAFLAAGLPAGVVAAGAFGAGLAMMLGNTIWESTMQRHVPAASLSRVSAYDWFGALAASALGMIVWGPIAEWVGFSTALWASAGAIVLTTLGLVSIPAVRRMRW